MGYGERQAWRTRKRVENAIAAIQSSGERLVLEELRYRARASASVIKRVAKELGVNLVLGRQRAQSQRGRRREETCRTGVPESFEEARARRIEMLERQVAEVNQIEDKRRGIA
jgi:hypothetical protein